MWIQTDINCYVVFLVQRQLFWHKIFNGNSQSQKMSMIVYLHVNLLFPYYFFMNCIIDQCYVCQSPINFTTYTFPYVMSLLTIRLAYDFFIYLFFFSFQCNTKVKRAKLELIFIIYLEHDYIDRSLSKHSKRKDRTKLLFN